MAEVLRLRSSGPQAVEEVWQKFVPSARLHRVDPRTFTFDWTSVETPGFSLVGYELAADVQSEVVPSDQLMACRVDSVGSWVGSARRDFDASQPWLFSDTPVRAKWKDTAQVRAFVFDLASATTTARQISGDDRLTLKVLSAEPRSRGWARQWEALYRYLTTTFAMTAADDISILEAELRRHALLTTLLAFPTTFTHAGDRSAQTRPAPATVRRALAYIESSPHLPITIDDIAREAGVSTRGLQAAFQRALGTTPSVHLRRVRLAGAHEDLVKGDPQTVREVAERWGFGDPSRFARYYRDEFGRNPSDTARST